MKKLFIITAILFSATLTFAQKTIYLAANLSVHFISPGPIKYVDISNKSVAGDLPVNNILRIKYRDTVKTNAVITIVGEKYIAQYRVVYTPNPGDSTIRTQIEIDPDDMRPLDFPGVMLSQSELKGLAARLLSKKTAHLETSKIYAMIGSLNHIYTAGDYIFLDVSYQNNTNLAYDIDELRFKIDDKKVTKATNVQSLEIKPDFILFDITSFKKHYRNIFVFKKFTFPGNKLLRIELSEKQLSGRILTLSIPYRDVLNADTINF